jgi:hypothetical protein
MFLNITLRLVYISKHNVSESRFSLRLQVKPTQLSQSIKLVLISGPNTTYRRHKEFAHVSLIDHPISLDLVITAEVRTLQLCPVRLSGKIFVLYVGTIQR